MPAAGEELMLHAESDQHLQTLIEEHSAANPEQLIIVDFFAQWCGPCRLIGPKVDRMAEQFGTAKVTFIKADVDEMEDSPSDYEITVMPTFIFLRGGKEIARFSGANDKKLLELIEQNIIISDGSVVANST